MMSLPIRRNNFDVEGFLVYLAEQGCEVGKPSNPYEVVRYRAYWKRSKKPETQIVYARENGLLTWTKGTQGHYLAFMEGKSLVEQSPTPLITFSEGKLATAHEQNLGGRGKNAKIRHKLLERDGDECWFCGEPMGRDCTIEHLIPRSDGGRNTMANYALAHEKCNQAAANKPLVEKVEMRLQMRVEKIQCVTQTT